MGSDVRAAGLAGVMVRNTLEIYQTLCCDYFS